MSGYVNKTEQDKEECPLKDAFQSDDSYKQALVDMVNGDRAEVIPVKESRVHLLKRKKIQKHYRWKLRWVPIANAIQGSKPIWVQKWVRVKIPLEEIVSEEVEQSEKPTGSLGLAAKNMDLNNQ